MHQVDRFRFADLWTAAEVLLRRAGSRVSESLDMFRPAGELAERTKMADQDAGATVDVSYAEGWEESDGRAVRPLTKHEAGCRDRDGRPYVVVYRVPGRSKPIEVHLAAWGDRHWGVRAFNESGRRVLNADLRLLDEPDRVFLLDLDDKAYIAETGRCFLPGPEHIVTTRGSGRSPLIRRSNRGTSWWLRKPTFGEHALLAPALLDQDTEITYRETSEPAEPPTPASDDLWGPPRPWQPGPLTALFQPGTLVATDEQAEMTVGQPREIAHVRIPSGRLAISEPVNFDDPCRELVEQIPPGAYPMQAAVVHFTSHYEDHTFPVTEHVAVRLLVRPEPVEHWELALAEGEDPRLLREGEAYGFGTDGATGCFADASAWEPLAHAYYRYLAEREDEAGEQLGEEGDGEGYVRTCDEETGADLVSFYTDGDGRYPVWLGYTSAGLIGSVAVICTHLPGLRQL